MQTVCPRCGTPRDGEVRFCTNCGADLNVAAPQSSTWYPPQQQQQQQVQVPSWASAGAGYQQQNWSQDSALNISQSQKDFIKRALTYVVIAIAVALVCLLALGLLAIFIPGLRCVFAIALVLAILIPWLIYVNIRRMIHRTVGRLDRMWWLWLS